MERRCCPHLTCIPGQLVKKEDGASLVMLRGFLSVSAIRDLVLPTAYHKWRIGGNLKTWAAMFRGESKPLLEREPLAAHKGERLSSQDHCDLAASIRDVLNFIFDACSTVISKNKYLIGRKLQPGFSPWTFSLVVEYSKLSHIGLAIPA